MEKYNKINNFLSIALTLYDLASLKPFHDTHH